MTQKSKDIQSQTEPYIVKSHDIHNNADYADWIADTKHRYLFFAENIEKLKLFASIIGAEKMHHAGAELRFEKLYQFAGELQFVVNHGVMSQAKTIGRTCTPFQKELQETKRLMNRKNKIE